MNDTNLLIGLLDPGYSGGHGFDNLHFRTDIEGTTVTDLTLTDLGTAISYFDDNVLDYGLWKDLISTDNVLDITFYFDLTEQHLGEGFNTNFIVGASVVPVPAAVWLFGSGLIGLIGLISLAKRKKA